MDGSYSIVRVSDTVSDDYRCTGGTDVSFGDDAFEIPLGSWTSRLDMASLLFFRSKLNHKMVFVETMSRKFFDFLMKLWEKRFNHGAVELAAVRCLATDIAEVYENDDDDDEYGSWVLGSFYMPNLQRVVVQGIEWPAFTLEKHLVESDEMRSRWTVAYPIANEDDERAAESARAAREPLYYTYEEQAAYLNARDVDYRPEPGTKGYQRITAKDVENSWELQMAFRDFLIADKQPILEAEVLEAPPAQAFANTARRHNRFDGNSEAHLQARQQFEGSDREFAENWNNPPQVDARPVRTNAAPNSLPRAEPFVGGKRVRGRRAKSRTNRKRRGSRTARKRLRGRKVRFA